MPTWISRSSCAGEDSLQRLAAVRSWTRSAAPAAWSADRARVDTECFRRFPQGSFTLAMWVYPTPGISSGLGTVFAMNTAAGDNVMSLSIDRGRNIYEYKVGACCCCYRCCPLPDRPSGHVLLSHGSELRRDVTTGHRQLRRIERPTRSHSGAAVRVALGGSHARTWHKASRVHGRA